MGRSKHGVKSDPEKGKGGGLLRNLFQPVTSEQQAVLDQPLHEDDRAAVEAGDVDENTAKALRHRRNLNFANDIDGAVHGGRLERKIIAAYAPPSLTTIPLTILISVYVVAFYEKVGAPLGLLAFFQALARAFDVVTDPTMSFISDSTRSKHGRRRPYMFKGAPLYCICLILLLLPQPSLGKTGVACWFGFFYIAFFLFYTFCNIPYDALAPELTDNQDDRSTLFFVCTMFDGLGSLFAVMMPVGVQRYLDSYRDGNSYKYSSCDNPGSYSYEYFGDVLEVIRPPSTIDALSSPGPWPMAGNGRSTAPPSVLEWSRLMLNATADTITGYNVTSDCDNATLVGSVLASTDEQHCSYAPDPDRCNWCECQAKALLTHNLDSTRYAYWVTGMVFGFWALLSLWTLVLVVKERGQLEGAQELKKPRPMVPSVLATMQNRPFSLLLPSWVLDSLGAAIIGSLIIYFVRYVVKPEFQTELGCTPHDLSASWRCDTTAVTGISVITLLFGAFVFTPVWLFLAKKLGKRVTWLMWSFTNGVTYLAYAPVGEGDVNLLIAMSLFNGFPLGAKFLADSIMADVIDYDEFMTGTRSEATYTMFKGFLPKIAAIPASAVPIVLLNTFGHVAAVDSIVQVQPESVTLFIKVCIIYIPSILSFWAFLIKLRYPFRTERDNEMITEGVAAHLVGKAAPDPATGVLFRPVHFDDEEEESINLLDSFPGVKVIERLLQDYHTGCAHILKRAQIQMVLAVLWIVSFAAITMATFPLLLSDYDASVKLQVIPVLSTVGSGMGITLCGFSYLRLGPAKRLLDHEVMESTLHKVRKQRTDLDRIRQFPATMRGGLTTRSILEGVVVEQELDKPGMEVLTPRPNHKHKAKDKERKGSNEDTANEKTPKQPKPSNEEKDIKSLKKKLDALKAKAKAGTISDSESKKLKKLKAEYKSLKNDEDGIALQTPKESKEKEKDAKEERKATKEELKATRLQIGHLKSLDGLDATEKAQLKSLKQDAKRLKESLDE